MPALNGSLRQLLGFLARYQADHGYAPTMREMRDELGIGSTNTVSYRLRQLEDRGLIAREPGKSRALRIVGSGGAPRADAGEAVAAP